MTNKKKCAVIFHSVAFGGVAKYSVYMANEFNKQGLPTDLVVPHAITNNIFSVYMNNVSCVKYSGYCWIPLNINGSWNYVMDPINSFIMARQLSDYDIIHVNDIHTSFPLIIAKVLGILKKDVMIVNHIHANVELDKIPWFVRIGIKLWNWGVVPCINKFLSHNIATSIHAKQNYKLLYPNNHTDIHIVPNGVDFDLFNNKAIQPYFSNSLSIDIVFVGRNEHRKGLCILMEAYTLLKERYDDICDTLIPRLTIISDDHNNIRKMFPESYETENYIRLLPFLDEDTYATELGTCDIMCAPSQYGESFGMVIVEAMAAGNVVVASDIEGYNTVIEDGVNGILVKDYSNPIEWYKVLVHLMKEPIEKRYAIRENAINDAKKKYEWASVAKQVLELDGI